MAKTLKKRKVSKRGNKKNNKKKVLCYKSCKNVPCNKHMPHCKKTSYCEPGGSKNWTICNILKRTKQNVLFKKRCKTHLCNKTKKGRKKVNEIDSEILHKKMPYIWRHLKRKTRKRLLSLAKKPIKKLNINFMKYP